MKILDNFACVLAALITATVAPCARGQTLYGVDSTGGFGAPMVVELTGPPTGPCLYPNGPMAGYAPFPAIIGGCPGPLPFAGWPAIDGDIAIDRSNDTLWVAGLAQVGGYTTAGVQVSGFNTPFNITGLGMASMGGQLWISSPNAYRRVLPACGGFAVTMGPFASPMGSALTDIDVDPLTGNLWVCTANGFVATFAPGAPAPACFFDAKTLGLVAPLTGLALDATTPGISTPDQMIYVTDGLNIARINATQSCLTGAAVLAGGTFPLPRNLFPVSGGPLSGLAFAAHGVTFGTSSGCTIALKGNSVVGKTPSLELSGAAPGNAIILVNIAALCPPIMFPVGPLYVLPVVTAGPFAHAGAKSVLLVFPAAVGVGQELYFQIGNSMSAGGLQLSSGLVLTLAR